MSSKNFYLAVILLIIILLVAYFVFINYSECDKSQFFVYTTPAIPLTVDAVKELRRRLGNIVEIGHRARAGAGAGVDVDGAAQSVANEVNIFIGRLTKLGLSIDSLPPTYANYRGIYYGLASTDYTSAAGSYIAAGNYFMKNGDRDFGESLIALGNELYQFQRVVHILGSSLDLE
jgi:hypothetical protein